MTKVVYETTKAIVTQRSDGSFVVHASAMNFSPEEATALAVALSSAAFPFLK